MTTPLPDLDRASPSGVPMTHVSTVDRFGRDVKGSPARSADAISLLREISDAAAVFTAQLDALSKRYPRLGQDADPLAVVLDQAAAAASDLHSSTTAAADTIAGRTAYT